ncbi:MAG TPA: DUF6807 family protein [Planctomycetota bacterium]|nr:DUF6807 family protein [Planctomycetota bacterium]
MHALGPCAALALAACASSGVTQPSAERSRLQWDEDDGSVALLRDGHEVWRFHWGEERAKTCFHPLALPEGLVLTRDQPADHRWHHGLWFSWKYIDGVNYWEHDRKTGRPAGRTTCRWRNTERRDDGSASIRLQIEYGPDGAAPVLAEERTLRVSAPADDGSFHIDWTARFTAQAEQVVLDRTPLPGEPDGKAHGGYAGLSLRLGDFADREAVTCEGPVAWNAQDRFRGRSAAFDYHGTLDGVPVGVAILAHEDNLNAPSPWYAIRSRGMSFFTPAVICFGAHRMVRGESFVLRYRVCVHPGAWDAARLQRELRLFHEDHP